MNYVKKSFLPFLLLFLVVGCSAMHPKSFDQSLYAAYTVQTSILQTTTGLLTRKQISKDDATRVLAISDEAGKALDSAREMRKTDNMDTANAQLTLATSILDQISVYLDTREAGK